ncbi:unnamed protein product [Candidula unifasciata]|uniref:Uncharacterized protein n=1 Tax=Candidula unifasciata TaxID=100452 RepID=A0A8S3ZX56_9EUPU|nr:unnamed protein product [Candidula unifasciata]
MWEACMTAVYRSGKCEEGGMTWNSNFGNNWHPLKDGLCRDFSEDSMKQAMQQMCATTAPHQRSMVHGHHLDYSRDFNNRQSKMLEEMRQSLPMSLVKSEGSPFPHHFLCSPQAIERHHYPNHHHNIHHHHQHHHHHPAVPPV